MERIVLRGRKIVGGSVAGEALVSKDGIGTYGSLDEYTGVITERNHNIYGKSVTGKILVFPFAKGSSAWACGFHNLRTRRINPIGMLVRVIDSKSALGAIACNVPTVTDFDQDPVTIIESGDWVEINADEGVVYVTKHA